MKKIVYIAIAIGLLFVFIGCHHKRTSQLDVLDHFIEINPDSTYSVLMSIQGEVSDYSNVERMQYYLLRLKCQNILDLPFASYDSIKAIADYYADNGSYNQALLSTYLLGRAYKVNGDEPMAVECFNKCLALKQPDTPDDVDYIQLSKVHSQLSEVYRDQKLYELGIKELDAANQCAYLGGRLSENYSHIG